MDFREAEDGFIKAMKGNILTCFADLDTFGYMKDNSSWQELVKSVPNINVTI